MLLHVVHETAYDYSPMVRTAQHMAHLKPATTAKQELLSHRLTVDPRPAQQTESVDVYGNTRSFFSLQFSHDWLRVQAESLVSTSPAQQPEDSLPWEEVAERMRYRRGTRYDAASEFAFASPYVPRDEAFAAYAQPVFQPGRPLLDAARELMARIHKDFEYAPAATDVNTPALEALAERRGVCQDFAHVMLGCLRSLGLPARYVSGYLLTNPAPGQPRLVGCDASHAWVSVYLPGADGPGAWADLDPTNDRAPGEDYVTLAIGRDYSDVSPMRGVIHGGANHSLRVAVTVTPAEAAAPAEADAP
ncbi:MAG TPA: transglutaminase family protein [Ramlibacter sp.]|nr:transglutaminase family protein [Ramlibacter sp.]